MDFRTHLINRIRVLLVRSLPDSFRYLVIHPERHCLSAASSVNTSRLVGTNPPENLLRSLPDHRRPSSKRWRVSNLQADSDDHLVVNWEAALEQPVPPGLDRNVLKGDRAAKRLRILLCKEMHVLGLRTGQVIDLADVRLRIGEQRGDHTCNVFHCDRRSLALAER